MSVRSKPVGTLSRKFRGALDTLEQCKKLLSKKVISFLKKVNPFLFCVPPKNNLSNWSRDSWHSIPNYIALTDIMSARLEKKSAQAVGSKTQWGLQASIDRPLGHFYYYGSNWVFPPIFHHRSDKWKVYFGWRLHAENVYWELLSHSLTKIQVGHCQSITLADFKAYL